MFTPFSVDDVSNDSNYNYNDDNSTGLGLEQQRVYRAISKGGNHVITGEAGTGKSYLGEMIAEDRFTIHLGPTGMSINHYKQGFTIARFLNASPKNIDDSGSLINNFLPPFTPDELRHSQIFIDECFMISSGHFIALNGGLQKYLNNRLPFGGVRIIMLGDTLQLPSINDSEPMFTTDAYKYGKFMVHNLREQHRQVDTDPTDSRIFKELLKCMRSGRFTPYYEDILRHVVNNPHRTIPIDAVHLFATVKGAAKINELKLSQLPGGTTTLYNKLTGTCGKKSKRRQVDVVLLKPGARVMITSNIYCIKTKTLLVCNGSTGTFVVPSGANRDAIKIAGKGSWKIPVWLDSTGSIIEIPAMKRTEYNIDKESIGTFNYWPIIHGWAITIHRAQGLTIDNVVLHGDGIFEPCQAYVGASRVRTISQLYGVNLTPDNFEHPVSTLITEYNRSNGIS